MQKASEKYTRGKIRESSYLLLLLGFFFVPGAYFILIFSALLSLATGAAIFSGIYYLFKELKLESGANIIFVLLFLGTLIGLYAILKGIICSFYRKPDFEPALKIDLNEEPELDSFIRTLCRKMNTKPPQHVIFHSQGKFGVFQGKTWTFDGIVRGRNLLMSVPLLSVLTINELRAILAHEFAHFTGRDTLYASIILPSYISIQTASEEMSRITERTANDLFSILMAIPLTLPNKALRLYLKIFHIIYMKISRTRERRADILSAETCGSESFSKGLTKASGVASYFDEICSDDIMTMLKQEKAFVNYYNEFRNLLDQHPGMLERLSEMHHNEVVDKHDAHPSIQKRLSAIPYEKEQFADFSLARGLIRNIESYEQKLTEYFTQLLSISLQPPSESPSYIACPKCKLENWDGYSKCQKCGTPLH